MKKYFFGLIMLCCLFITGCFGNNNNDVLKDIKSKYNNLKAYELTGNLEIVNNDDVYNYDVKVIYQKTDKYYVSLKNLNNGHEQIILKNDDGVYVLTPSLNKSFKFQSDWPNNNSQVYLIQSILDDIVEDEERSVVSDESGHIFTTNVDYPNNRNLVRQIVVFDSKLNFKKVSVVDENDISQMTMTFATIDLEPEISKDTFDLDKIMGTTNSDNNSTETSGVLEDIIYPLYIPSGTVLTSEDKVVKTNGERVIMTFEGEKPFLLVEETVSIEDEYAIIPTYGEPYLLIDTVAALTENSITWNSNGIEYYIVSDVMSQDELIEIARSVNVIPTMK